MKRKKKVKSKKVSQKRKSKKKRNVLDSLKISKTPRVRKELLDYDYLDKLNPKELEWLAKFTDEYAGGNIKKGKRGPLTRHLHRSNKLAKECYDANNRRNNDLYGVTKVNSLLSDLNNYYVKEEEKISNGNITEDALISQIDEKNALEEALLKESLIDTADDTEKS